MNRARLAAALRRLAVQGPDHSRCRHADSREEYGVRSTQPVEQRDNGQASQRASRQVGGIKRGNVFGLARKNHGEFQAGDKERNGGRQVNRGEAKKIRGRDFQRDRSAQHDDQHDRHNQRVDRAQPRDQGTGLESRQAFLPQVGKHASGAQAEQGNRNRQKCEVVEQHHGKQPGERQFKKQGGKAAERDAGQHGAIRGPVCAGVWSQEGCLAHRARFARNAASLTEDRVSSWPSSLQNDLRDRLLGRV